MNWCDLCRKPKFGLVKHVWDDKQIVLCAECYSTGLTLDQYHDIVQERRWKASKSERQWNAGDPITDEDRGLEQGTGC